MLASVFEFLPHASIITKSSGEIIMTNQLAEEMFGFSPGDLIGENIDLLIKEKVTKKHTKKNGSINNKPIYYGLNKEGRKFPIDIKENSMVVDGQELILRALADDTESRKIEQELEKYSAVVEQSQMSVMVTDINGNIEYVNPRFTEITGYTEEEIIEQNPMMLQFASVSQETHEILWKTIKAGKVWRNELRNRKKDGRFYWVHETICPIFDSEGEITNFLVTHQDATELQYLTKKLSWQATYDPLTGLVNRNEFERKLDRSLITNDRDTTEHALCFMNIDQFKIVNDVCSHIGGDELLCQVSHVLKNVIRKGDTLARLDGDEFAVLMEHCSLEHAERAAAAVQNAVEKFHFLWDERIFKIGISIGLVSVNEEKISTQELLGNASTACYMAKDLGRNRVYIYHADDAETVKQHGEMQRVTQIHKALDEDRFILYAQPIATAMKSTMGLHHYEILLRMEGEEEKTLIPAEFLPVAERYNLISKIDRWVIKNAIKLLGAYPDFLSDIGMCSINLSGASFTEDRFLDFVLDTLKEADIPPGKICFEITETVAISNLATASQFISALKEFGCQFALDDFGSGLSSFAYLKNLEVDYLKIDGIFVKDIVDNDIDYAMVKSINEIGHVMGKKTIAEFVENDEIRDKLIDIGVDYVQGYGIGKPEPFDGVVSQGLCLSPTHRGNS